MSKKTLILGVSTNPNRYSNVAAIRLLEFGQNIELFGQKEGQINGLQIQTEWDSNWEIDTITLYIGPQNQNQYYERICALKPRRVIFNPGSENKEFIRILKVNAIKSEIACTLVLLSLKQY
jgi:predicted CoA-binding protein